MAQGLTPRTLTMKVSDSGVPGASAEIVYTVDMSPNGGGLHVSCTEGLRAVEPESGEEEPEAETVTNATEIVAEGGTGVKDPMEDSRLTCSSCGRKFNPASLERHQRVCQQVFGSTRPTFDAMKGSVVTSNVKPRGVSSLAAPPEYSKGLLAESPGVNGNGPNLRDIEEHERRVLHRLQRQMDELQDMKQRYYEMASAQLSADTDLRDAVIRAEDSTADEVINAFLQKLHDSRTSVVPPIPLREFPARAAGIDTPAKVRAEASRAQTVVDNGSRNEGGIIAGNTRASADGLHILTTSESGSRPQTPQRQDGQLKVCKHCGRRFNPASLEKHMAICRSVFGKSVDKPSRPSDFSSQWGRPPPPGGSVRYEAKTPPAVETQPQVERSSLLSRGGLSGRFLKACPHCGRLFRPSGYDTHVGVCQSVFPQFDSSSCSRASWPRSPRGRGRDTEQGRRPAMGRSRSRSTSQDDVADEPPDSQAAPPRSQIYSPAKPRSSRQKLQERGSGEARSLSRGPATTPSVDEPRHTRSLSPQGALSMSCPPPLSRSSVVRAPGVPLDTQADVDGGTAARPAVWHRVASPAPAPSAPAVESTSPPAPLDLQLLCQDRANRLDRARFNMKMSIHADHTQPVAREGSPSGSQRATGHPPSPAPQQAPGRASFGRASSAAVAVSSPSSTAAPGPTSPSRQSHHDPGRATSPALASGPPSRSPQQDRGRATSPALASGPPSRPPHQDPGRATSPSLALGPPSRPPHQDAGRETSPAFALGPPRRPPPHDFGQAHPPPVLVSPPGLSHSASAPGLPSRQAQQEPPQMLPRQNHQRLAQHEPQRPAQQQPLRVQPELQRSAERHDMAGLAVEEEFASYIATLQPDSVLAAANYIATSEREFISRFPSHLQALAGRLWQRCNELHHVQERLQFVRVGQHRQKLWKP